MTALRARPSRFSDWILVGGEKADEVGIALDDVELIVDDDDCGGHFLEESVGFFLRQRARVGSAHHAFGVASDEGAGKVAAGVIAAAAAIEFVFD